MSWPASEWMVFESRLSCGSNDSINCILNGDRRAAALWLELVLQAAVAARLEQVVWAGAEGWGEAGGDAELVEFGVGHGAIFGGSDGGVL